MIKNNNYIGIREVLNRVLRHPLLQDVSLEQAIEYTLDFIGIFGLPETYDTKEEEITIKEYKSLLPCDLVSIIQVKNKLNDKCLRSTTDTFSPNDKYDKEETFKTAGNIIFTSFKEGSLIISYKAIHVDNDGIPMLPDNPIFLKALEAYIKKEVFTILFDMNKINQVVYQNTQQQYAWLAGQLQAEFSIPSLSEMESISRMWSKLIPGNTEFDKGFRDLGNREYLKVQ